MARDYLPPAVGAVLRELLVPQLFDEEHRELVERRCIAPPAKRTSRAEVRDAVIALAATCGAATGRGLAEEIAKYLRTPALAGPGRRELVAALLRLAGRPLGREALRKLLAGVGMKSDLQIPTAPATSGEGGVFDGNSRWH